MRSACLARVAAAVLHGGEWSRLRLVWLCRYTYKKPDQYWGGVRKEDLDKAQAQRPRRDGITVHTADLPATPRTTEPVCFAGTAHTATGNSMGFVATAAGGAGGVAVVPAAGLSPRSLDEEDEEGSGIEEDDSDSDVEDELEEVAPVVAARRGLSPALRAASPAPGMPPMHPELTAPTMSDSIGSLPRSEVRVQRARVPSCGAVARVMARG